MASDQSALDQLVKRVFAFFLQENTGKHAPYHSSRLLTPDD